MRASRSRVAAKSVSRNEDDDDKRVLVAPIAVATAFIYRAVT
jgi:hypothetical protein